MKELDQHEKVTAGFITLHLILIGICVYYGTVTGVILGVGALALQVRHAIKKDEEILGKNDIFSNRINSILWYYYNNTIRSNRRKSN